MNTQAARRAFKRAKAHVAGIDPYNAQGYRIVVPLHKEQAHRALELDDADLQLAVAAAREGFEAVVKLLGEGKREQVPGLFDNVTQLHPRA